ncbi:subunit VIb of cytochrome c oxidase [Chloropicon roscoffensis]|uniref:Subunit VIb of cytochrome c oxidase n=1 Tax=Chloropicon roscoffensis TaxID=1461544 RepID=A0A7S3FP34_9CHLO|mmetsp:Transcript_3916/g.11779  ORF Transcript_3916/g.11779 Transcript_3916/m.11779 type:complete len:118 (+) Transcript_3916:81-434(+)|eukprot:CAMPEP_0196637382 /NCGR_PEP_ID=MMETSP1085-20130531/407_1 /TAXON_ID=41879 ORGANISM="Pycnococcus sp, Strain CCMP1998" /NCGR_SAMPLE_ID=MMETSP1085 /ASSEMBLY_ACC=CAM_ASM_000807 /LENGTH=117 /DNA_ID=CAMNT_0041965857 /DNA_START=63 /DNA_END=416 /DNA_ORIENTATION=-
MGSSMSVHCEEEAVVEVEAPEEEEAVAAVEEEEAEEEEEPQVEVKLGTAPYDSRFTTTNQARHCYTRYNEFHKCAAEKGEEAEDCKFFQKAYRSMCPSIWVEKWNEERESGTFAGRY